jgi:hypothetical protein
MGLAISFYNAELKRQWDRMERETPVLASTLERVVNMTCPPKTGHIGERVLG